MHILSEDEPVHQKLRCCRLSDPVGACPYLACDPWPSLQDLSKKYGCVWLVAFYPNPVAVAIASFRYGEHDWYVVMGGGTLFESVRNGMRFFADPFWKGPKPDANTVFEVSLVGDQRKWRVSARFVKQ